MTSIHKASGIFILLLIFTWRVSTENSLNADGNVEDEEEKMLDISHGNESSLERTTSLPIDDFTTSPVLDDELISKKKHAWWENETILTDYEELNEEKNDASPESVDRDLLEKVNYFLPNQPLSETPLFTDFNHELSSSLAKPVLLSYQTVTSSMSRDNLKTATTQRAVSSTCGFGDRKCNLLLEDSTDSLNSKVLEGLVLPTIESFYITSSDKLPAHSEVPEQISREALNTSPDISLTDIVTTSPLSSVTAQTSDNLILEERTNRLKDDVVLQGLSNKNDKSKQSTKERESSSNLTDELPARIFFKTETTLPVPEKDSVSPRTETPVESVLLSKILNPSPTPLSSSVFIKIEASPTTDSYIPQKTNILPEVEPKKEAESSSSIDFKALLISSTPVLNTFSSVSRPYPKPEVFSLKEKGLSSSTILTPSFRSSAESTETESPIKLKPSLSRLQETSQFSLESSIVSTSPITTSVLRSQIIHPTDTSIISSTPTNLDKSTIPPPRLTNPGCSSLPVCVEITLLETNWEHFCSQEREFLEFLSRSLSYYTRPIHPYHIVLDTEVCSLSSSIRSSHNSPDISVAFYITNESGEYEERLTELSGVILRKWAPSAFKSSVIEVRMYSESVSTPLPIIPELNSGFVAAVSISAVAGVALCLLCILLVIMKQKLIQGRHSDTTTPTADAYSLDSLSISASFRRRRTRRSARSYLNHAFNDQEIPSHPLNEKTLSNCLKNRDLLEEEFKRLPMNMPKLDSIPEGAHVKNRYSNILPKPETRVMLADPSGDPLKCYINANYVKGYEGKSAFYIACQASLPEGIEDFWRMVWEQQCRVIIMLTMFEENGTSRCAVYFPQSTLISQQPYGDFQVSLLKKDVYEFYTLSTLRLLDLEKNLFRDVVHLWFTGWPDVGVPKDSSSLVTFVQQCRPFINCNSGPTVVHCSTGTGRTGVFLALDICMREYEESRSIDILQCISQLRRDRAGAVQNKDQYILIHDAMLEYISRLINQSQRPSMSS